MSCLEGPAEHIHPLPWGEGRVRETDIPSPLPLSLAGERGKLAVHLSVIGVSRNF